MEQGDPGRKEEATATSCFTNVGRDLELAGRQDTWGQFLGPSCSFVQRACEKAVR